MSEADPTTVLVVTPSMGGHYFGELLAGLAREVGAEGGRVVVVETLPESAPQDEAGGPGDFAIPVAWSLVDGVVSVTTAVGAPYLRGLRDAGRPVILSSTLMADFDAPAAMPDNHGGAVTAVEHLLRHGHTSVGFVGNFAQQDIRDLASHAGRDIDGRTAAGDRGHREADGEQPMLGFRRHGHAPAPGE